MRRCALLIGGLALNMAGLSLALPALASATHAPAIRPAEFVGEVNNPYFPLIPGTTLRYRGEKDGKPSLDSFEVTRARRTIQGVRTTVIHDSLFLAGHLAEVTTDWYAQDRRGNVWYFGEATKTLKRNGKVESSEGSWRAGIHGARAGIFFPGAPRVGLAGQQEFFKGHAEDHFGVLSLNASVTVPYVSSSRALKTKEWTPLEPAVLDNKYYVAGIGTVLELAIKGPAERLELVSATRP